MAVSFVPVALDTVVLVDRGGCLCSRVERQLLRANVWRLL